MPDLHTAPTEFNCVCVARDLPPHLLGQLCRRCSTPTLNSCVLVEFPTGECLRVPAYTVKRARR